jgi:hypothetical protein
MIQTINLPDHPSGKKRKASFFIKELDGSIGKLGVTIEHYEPDGNGGYGEKCKSKIFVDFQDDINTNGNYIDIKTGKEVDPIIDSKTRVIKTDDAGNPLFEEGSLGIDIFPQIDYLWSLPLNAIQGATNAKSFIGGVCAKLVYDTALKGVWD